MNARQMLVAMEGREGRSYLLGVGAEGSKRLAVVGDCGGDVGHEASLGQHVREGLTTGGHEHLRVTRREAGEGQWRRD